MVPVILTILFGAVPWLVLVIISWPQLSELLISFPVLGLGFQPPEVYFKVDFVV
jgi:hypothetical protein